MTVLLLLLPLLLPQESDGEYVHTSDHYEIRSEISIDLSRRVALHLERIHTEFQRLLPFESPPGPRPRHRVRILETRERYDEYNRRVHGIEKARDSFLYQHYGLGDARNETVAFRIPDPPLLERLQHESFHQYFRSFIDEPPQWLNEGLAEYFEAWTPAGIALNSGQLRRWREPIRKLDPLGKTGELSYVSLPDLVRASKDEWMAKERVTYAESWALCYFLLESGDETDRKILSDYLQALRPKATREWNNNEGWKCAFAEVDLADLESRFLEHTDRLRLPGHGSFQEGLRLLEEEKPADAVEAFSNAILEMPSYDRYFYYRGAACFSSGRFSEAETDLQTALRLFPEYSSAHFLLGKTLFRLGRLPEARDAFETALRFDAGLRPEAAPWLDRIDQQETVPKEPE